MHVGISHSESPKALLELCIPQAEFVRTLSVCFTDLRGTAFLRLDKRVGVVKFVLARDSSSTLPSLDNLLRADNELLGDHLLDRPRTPLRHYSRRIPRHTSLVTLPRSWSVSSLVFSYPDALLGYF